MVILNCEWCGSELKQSGPILWYCTNCKIYIELTKKVLKTDKWSYTYLVIDSDDMQDMYQEQN